MPGFLRRKTIPPPKQPLDTPPPSLPPLILSTSLSDTRAAPLPPAASPPVLPSPPEYPLDDLWDPWRTYAPPRLDSHPRRASSHPPASPSARISDAPIISTHPSPVATAPTPVQQLSYPKCETLGNHPLSSSLARPSSPPVLRGQPPPPSNFDFEDSLSAANVTSVVNQFRSYHPHIRHSTSPAPHPQMDIQHPHHSLPQKPGSSSSLSSSSHNTDATRRTDGSYASATSASSVPSFTKVIDISTGRLDPVGSRDPNAPPSSVPLRPRGPAVDRLPSVSSPTSRPLTTLNASTRARRTPAPPSSYSDRVRTLARQTSQPNLSPSAEQPMLFDLLRSGNQGSSCPLRKGPLIFAAMSATPPPGSLLNKTPVASPTDGNVYSSPSALLDPSPLTRSKASVSSILKRSSLVHEDPGTDVHPLAHKSSKSSLRAAVERTPSSSSRVEATCEHSRPRVLTKSRPTTPQKASMPPSCVSLPERGDPLLLDEDPFARAGGVRMLKPRAHMSRTPSSSSLSMRMSREDGSSEDGHVKSPYTPPPPLPKALLTSANDAAAESDTPQPCVPDEFPPTPDEYKTARQQRRGQWLEKAPPQAVADVVARQLSVEEEPPREPTPAPVYFPIMWFMENANLLPLLLSYLSYSEWLALYNANKQIRDLFQCRILREFVLVRFLGTVGYSKWDYEWAEPIALSMKDLHNYLRGVAMPAHQYARLSATYLQPKAADRVGPTTFDTPDILALALTTRAYTKVVLRLRSQAESEAKYIKTLQAAESNHARKASHPGTRQPSVSSRTPSPTSSHFHAGHHARGERTASTSSSVVSRFKSPLYRPGRAPVLRVFVPSPEGEWLSDAGVVECEAELKRSGVLKLLRVGDVVWDVAVGDEGNLGRLMWDGSYLVDLDYRYSRVGELSPYFHSLAFSPSYFHRVIRIGGSATHNPHCNPIVYIDVSPFGHEIATNLQLLQDRARTETPHGALHDVVRWVHRSTFTVRPPTSTSKGQSHTRSRSVRVPIPNVDGLYVDPGWYGTVVLEAEGTNEGLVDLQTRCGPGVFPPRAESLATKIRNEKEKENRRVWRILREKSRPGEIWLRAVQVQERLM